jgi:hypothetical protein
MYECLASEWIRDSARRMPSQADISEQRDKQFSQPATAS